MVAKKTFLDDFLRGYQKGEVSMLNLYNNNNNEEPAVGKLLISEPFLFDPNFNRTVILLCEYNESGVLGFILNKPLELKLDDVIEIETSLKVPLWLGGPVQHNTLQFIHCIPELSGESIEILPGVYWGGDFEA